MQYCRLLTVLALIGFSLACGGLGGEEPATQAPDPTPSDNADQHTDTSQTAWERYAESRYDYCDATVLAGMWGDTPIDQAKKGIGNFLISGDGELLESKLGWARQHALDNFSDRSLRCHYDQIGFTFEDAIALGNLWGIDSWEAKMRLEEKYLRDGHQDTFIREALREAYQSSGQVDPIDLYASSEFEYCDAKVLSSYWGTDTYDAKLKIGVMINNGDENSVSSTLQTAQRIAADNMDSHDLRCNYSEIGFSYDDAVALAGLWGMDTWDAKIRIEEKYLRDGHERNHIDHFLRRAQQQHR
ncbi:MAG: hypothetical protein P8R54_23490 [Myxococcota bacterium]|nr:hypothetical protein [Myxococcota bacterium]